MFTPLYSLVLFHKRIGIYDASIKAVYANFPGREEAWQKAKSLGLLDTEYLQTWTVVQQETSSAPTPSKPESKHKKIVDKALSDYYNGITTAPLRQEQLDLERERLRLERERLKLACSVELLHAIYQQQAEILETLKAQKEFDVTD